MDKKWQYSIDGETWCMAADALDANARHRMGYKVRSIPPTQESTGERAAAWLRQVADRLIEKSKSYGDSVGNPVRIFSKAGATEGIKVRIDDKLSRVARGHEFPGEDVIVDLVGYLALLAVAEEGKTDE